MRPTAHRRVALVLGLLCVAPVGAGAQDAPASPHGRLRVRIECSACHTPAGWRPLRRDLQFDHAQAAGFPLTGRHAQAACASCHPGLRFDQPRAAPGDCVSCHQDVHQGKLSEQCANCHTTSSFTDASRREFHDRTAFPLTGPHAAVPCAACHRNDLGGAFTALPTECVSCHRAGYEAAHGGRDFPADCLMCHRQDRWSGASFDHAGRTGFALVGAHAATPCSACHVAPDNHVKWTPANQNDCVACHRSDYDAHHAGSGFPTTCTSCHTVSTWSGATFNHATVANGFALVGAHAATPCSSCHVAPDNHVKWTPANQNDCVACHRSDYDAHHAGSGFPTTCTSCHTVDTWQGATFNHDGLFFPIYSGSHAGRWTSCQQCHPSAGDYSVFTCVTCHERTVTNSHHTQVPGYTYESTRCYSCHPRGSH